MSYFVLFNHLAHKQGAMLLERHAEVAESAKCSLGDSEKSVCIADENYGRRSNISSLGIDPFAGMSNASNSSCGIRETYMSTN